MIVKKAWVFLIVVPHWSEFCSGVWPGRKRWKRLCCSLHVRTRTVSPQYVSADESSGFPGESRPYYSLRTTAETQNTVTAPLDQKYCSNCSVGFDDVFSTHSALVRLLSRVSAHMNHQHVLGFKWPLFSWAFLPVTHKLLLLSMDVLIVDVLWGNETLQKESGESFPKEPFAFL